jgi:hypothetical protein
MEEFGIFENINKDLYFIGDIHGDFYAFKQALELTECIIFDKQNFNEICKEDLYGIVLTDGCEYYKNKIKWNPEKKDSMIIFAGDLVDRCRITSESCDFVVNDEDCDNQIINILLELDKQALKYNSRVLFVLGNHELMNLQDKLKYVSFKGLYNGSRTTNIKNTIFNNINSIFGLIRINNYIICHGGINPNFVKEYNKSNDNSEFVISYNKMLRETLKDTKPNYYLLNDKYGPFWDRSNGLDNKHLTNEECELLFFNNILNIADKNIVDNLKLVVAHCPQIFNSEKKGINCTNCGKFENRIWRIDVSMSRAFDMYIYDINTINTLLDKIQKMYTIKNNQKGGSNLLLIATTIALLYKASNNNNNDNNNVLDFYVNRDRELNKVQILKINKDKKEEIIKGVISLEYFYNTVFAEQDIKYRYLYVLQDMYISFSRKINSNYNLEINILNKIDEIKTKLFFELYPRDERNTMTIQIK